MLDDLDDTADANELRVVTSSEGDVGVVQAAGELDANSVERLRGAFDDVFAGGQSTIVVDLAGVSFIDSSGLSVLIYAYKQAKERDGSLTVRSASPTVTHLLEITGQSERFLSPGP